MNTNVNLCTGLHNGELQPLLDILGRNFKQIFIDTATFYKTSYRGRSRFLQQWTHILIYYVTVHSVCI